MGWIADLTYVKAHSGWVYVAFVIDGFSRFIVGWQASRSLHADLALDEQRHTMRLAQVWLVKPKQMVPAGNTKHHPRTIHLTREMLDILQRQRAWQKGRESEATRQEGYAWKTSGLVFTTAPTASPCRSGPSCGPSPGCAPPPGWSASTRTRCGTRPPA